MNVQAERPTRVPFFWGGGYFFLILEVGERFYVSVRCMVYGPHTYTHIRTKLAHPAPNAITRTRGREHQRQAGLERRTGQGPKGREVAVVVTPHVEAVAAHAVWLFCVVGVRVMVTMVMVM